MATNTERQPAFAVDLYGNQFTFVPESVLNKGYVVGDVQKYLPKVLDPEFQSRIAPYSRPLSVANIDEVSKQNLAKTLEKNNFRDTQGYLLPNTIANELFQGQMEYELNQESREGGLFFGPISGLATNDQGVKYFNVSTSGQQNSAGWIGPGGELKGEYYIPGDKKKWYETPLGIISGAALALSGLGLAGLGPLASSGAALGSGISLGSTASGIGGGALGTGLTAGTTAAGIGGGALGTGLIAGAAGAGLAAGVAAPITSATAVPAGEFAYPGVEVAPSFTPAPGSLQAALPSLGVETAASAAPFTAIPGSFQAALPALGIASAPSLAGNLATSSGISATDALRIANQARGLLGAGQNPIIPQQQGLPQQAGGSQGVDYSGLLSLLQLQAGTPGVAPLTAPAQLRQIYQPTLLPNVLSLLG